MTNQTAGVVIGTAGHIDHGKTTLVKALTGRDMDTLGEEIRRGITISPGFTWLETGEGVRAGLIDVPGHERFIKNMIAGAAGIDYAMLVVAANDGVKPQTLEHLWILETLGLKAGLVVLTKCDMVDELMIELACDDIAGTLRGTFLEGAEIARVDSVSGRGIGELKSKLGTAVRAAVKRNISAPARLHIDRVFTKKGFGAVVTGTLAEGTVTAGDDLLLYPSGDICKARGIQVHEAASDSVGAGCRAAINLSGVKAAGVKRGDILTAAEMNGSHLADVKLRLFPKAARGVAFWDRLRLYIGTRELFCRAVPLSGKDIKPGGEDFCQLRLEDSLFCKRDDYFVVRTYSPMETIGGGFIVDPNPARHSRMNDALLSALSVKETGQSYDILADYISSHPGAAAKEIAAYAALSADEAKTALDGLESEGLAFKLAEAYFHADFIENIRETALSALDSFHKSNPLKKGMPKEELRSRLSAGMKPKALDALFTEMEAEGLIKTAAGLASLRSFEVKLADKQRQISVEMLSALLSGGFQPPPVSDLTRGDKRYAEVLNLLSPENVIFLDKLTVMHVEYYNKAKESLTAYFT
jgi:selenocysteine-specific elongation factor